MKGVEALFYEHVGSAAVAAILGPLLTDAVAGAGRVLDVGCGGGAQRVGSVGIDPGLGQLRRARRRGVRTPLVAASALALPFADGAFDAVVSSCSLKHWPDLAAGLAECTRVLRPGGRLVVAEIDGGVGPGSDDLRRFAARTRIPPGLRRLYPTLARRTFVPAAPAPEAVAALLPGATWRRIDGLPFYVVEA
jgi:ubiquinone/menaquinone biosynthesis C-methylase UbiE